jgi:hypothetical protein
MRRIATFLLVAFIGCLVPGLALTGVSGYEGGQSFFLPLGESSLAWIAGADMAYNFWTPGSIACVASWQIPSGYVTSCAGQTDGTNCIYCHFRNTRFTVTQDDDGILGADGEGYLPCSSGNYLVYSTCSGGACSSGTDSSTKCAGSNIPAYLEEP